MTTESTAADISTYDPKALRDKWYREGWYSDLTCVDAMELGGSRYADVPVVYSGDTIRESTVGEVHARAVEVATALQARGIGVGDAVAVQLANGFECSATYEAVLLTGATLVPVVAIYGPNEVSFILEQSRARVLIMPERIRSTRYSDRIPGYLSLPDLELVVTVGTSDSGNLLEGVVDWDSLSVDRPYVKPAPHPDSVAVLVYTSGTTSAPKGVQHSHNSFLAEQRTAPQLLSGAADAVHLVSFPPGHIAGVGSMMRPILHGTRAVYMEAWDPSVAAGLIARYRVTSTVGTPFHLTGILDLEGIGNKLSTLREFLVGAATMPDELGRRAEEAGIVTFRCYGSTEQPTISASRVSDDAHARTRTDGVPILGVEIRIIDESGADVASGVEGEVVTRGPDQFIGYRDSSLDRAAFTEDGWMHTGDLGNLDSKGRLTITDRIKDVIIRAGETISSGQIEDVLNQHPSVSEAVVVAAPDERYGEVAAAVVILNLNASIDLESIRSYFAKSGLAKQKTPEKLLVVEEFPRTPVGKIRKADIRREYFPKM